MSTAGTPSTILPSNVSSHNFDDTALDNAASDESGRSALADMVFSAGILALLVKILVSAGVQLGGPLPTDSFLSTLVPLLAVPLAILLVVLLAPGGLIRYPRPGWRFRSGLAVSGIAFFAVSLALLNLPVLLNHL